MTLKNIKICGITTPETLKACIDIDVGFIGFNFVPQSPRYISIHDAVVLTKNMPRSIAKVALVVNETDFIINDIVKNLNPDYIQFHGSESLNKILEIKQKFNIKIIKAISVATKQDIEMAKTYTNHVDIILYDAKPKKHDTITLSGGHGQKFDWTLLNDIPPNHKPFMLAGGLNYTNLIQAKTQTTAHYFDICSGVEETKGIKSVALITELKKLSEFF